MIDPPCPQCGEELTPVPSIWLDNTAPFWSPTKAGEWLCTNCPDNGKGRHGVAYFWEHEVKHESMSDEPLPFAEGLTFKPIEGPFEFIKPPPVTWHLSFDSNFGHVRLSLTGPPTNRFHRFMLRWFFGIHSKLENDNG